MSENQTGYSEQAEIVTPEVNDAPVGFFAVGIVINLVLIGAYFIWARRQWKKSGRRDKS